MSISMYLDINKAKVATNKGIFSKLHMNQFFICIQVLNTESSVWNSMIAYILWRIVQT